MIFDTHSHCYWQNLLPDIDTIVQKMHQNGVKYAVQIGCDIATSQQAIDLANRFPDVFFATVGLHPETAQNIDSWRNDFDNIPENFDIFLQTISQENNDFWNEIFVKNEILSSLEMLLKNHKNVIVAIGECGVDFHYLDGTNGGQSPVDWKNLSSVAKHQIENQQFWWLAQWKLAQKYQLPLVIHTRDARDFTVDFMQKFHINRVVMHCYSEDAEMAQKLLDFSREIYFSFSGIVTYKKSLAVQETAKMLPLDRILVETDSPFLAPQPVRGTVNSPANVWMNLAKIIELRPENPELITKIIFENSLRFYSLT